VCFAPCWACRNDAGDLRAALLRLAAESDAFERKEADRFGQRYSIEFMYRGRSGEARIRSAWIVREGEDIPRFVTCYVV
jgi:hypothetical protein